MKSRRLLQLFSVLIIFMLVISACSSNGGGTTTTTTKDDSNDNVTTTENENSSSEIIELEFMNLNEAWDPVVWGDDPVTAEFIDRTGIKLICSAPAGDWEQIANVMLVSNDYPELLNFPGHGTATFNKYIAAGALHAIDDLSSEYNYPKILDGSTVPVAAQTVHRSELDGKLYAVPNWFSEDGFGSVGQTISVRNDIYIDFGEPELKTMDDFYAYLEELRDAELTFDGNKVWPLGFGHTDINMVGNVANIYGANIQTYMYYNEDNKRVELMLRNPALIDALNFLNKGYREGVIDPESFTFDSTQMDEAYVQGKYATVMNWFWNMWTANSALSQVDPEVYYKSIDLPQGKPGVQQYFGYTHTGGDIGFTVTKNCKDPEAATKIIDYLLSPEGAILNFYGVEGETMEFRDGEPWLLDGVYEAKLADWTGYALSHGIRVFDFMNNQKYNWERQVEAPDRMANREIATKYAFDATKLKAIQVDSTTDEGILRGELMAELQAELTRIIIVEDPNQIEAMVQAVLEDYEDRGLIKLEDEWSRQYNRLLELENK